MWSTKWFGESSEYTNLGYFVWCLVNKQGVHVSRDSIVAATTTLCKDYTTPNVIIGGVPGRNNKTDVNWSNKRI